MSLNRYQQDAYAFCMPSGFTEDYLIAGLSAEAGEVAGKYAKYVRDDTSADVLAEEMKKELGDVLWFVAVLGAFYGFTLQDISDANIKKLSSRKQRNVLTGSGDNR